MKEKQVVSKGGRMIVILLAAVVVFILGGLAAISMPKVMASVQNVGSCDVNYTARNAVYNLDTGYYTIEKTRETVWIIGGLAKNQSFEGILKKMSWACSVPNFIDPFLKQIKEGTKIIDSSGETHIVYVAFSGTDQVKEVVVAEEPPLP